MVASAPRYDPRIDHLVVEHDDEAESMAETCRRVASAAEALGLVRPSIVHLRTLVREERERKRYERDRAAELRAIALETTGKVVTGRVPNLYQVLDRIEKAGRPRS